MQIVRFPNPEDWAQLLARPVFDQADLFDRVKPILQGVQEEGDVALKAFTARFDQVELDQFGLTDAERAAAGAQLSSELKKALQQAYANIKAFHQAQKQATLEVETMPGVHCWRRQVPIDKVGLYIPGGTAPLFSTLLMLGVPAKIAGCPEIVLVTPPQKDGSVHPALVYVADLIGIEKIFKVGGAQAVAALAYGTETIPAVYKIFGPGNQYVTAAKQLVQQEGLAIDMPAGPSEVLVCADQSAVPAFVASDLLSQAEHGADSQVVLVAFEEAFAQKVLEEVKAQIELLPRKEIAQKALENSICVIVKDRVEAVNLINQYAPEHLILALEEVDAFANKITNAGSIFLGNFTPESVGDYASGTNHTLPTNGFARMYSGVNLGSFMKSITYQRLSAGGLQTLGPSVVEMAKGESLDAHAQAVQIRLDYLKATNQ